MCVGSKGCNQGGGLKDSKGSGGAICAHASKATTTSEGFVHLKNHTLYIVQCCMYTEYFSPLHVKNKPSEGVEKCAFILGPVSMVATVP
jgi:hypothetical protein